MPVLMKRQSLIWHTHYLNCEHEDHTAVKMLTEELSIRLPKKRQRFFFFLNQEVYYTCLKATYHILKDIAHKT